MPRQKQLVLVVGAGGHAKVVIDILSQMAKYKIVGLVDRMPSLLRTLCGIPVIGDEAILADQIATGVTAAIIAIGDNRRRLSVAEQLRTLGFSLVNAISPHAVLSPSAQLGQGLVIAPGAVINAGAVIGDNVIINTNASVDHDCVIETGSHIAPGCALAGSVRVGRGSLLGVGTKVIPGRQIGEGCIVGAGSVVIRNLPAGSVAYGNPAVIRYSQNLPPP